jgi:hypothetical protein
MSLLQIISGDSSMPGGAARKCGVTPPATIIGSSDPNAPLLLALAQEEGEELAREHEWQALKVDYTVATLGAEAQTALPADFERFTAKAELWNRTTQQKYTGPTDDTEWGRIKALAMVPMLSGWWRLIGGVLQITPAPTAGQTLAFPYMSKNFVRSNTGTAKAAFTADTDTTVFPERVIRLGIIWRWKEARGLAYAEDLETYERAKEKAAGNDRGRAALVVGRRRLSGDIPTAYPGAITP